MADISTSSRIRSGHGYHVARVKSTLRVKRFWILQVHTGCGDQGAISTMRRGRATGPDEISTEFWNNTSETSMEWLSFLVSFYGQLKCQKNEDGVQWCHCTRKKVVVDVS